MKEQETQNNNINTELPDYEDFTEYDEDYDGDGEIDSFDEEAIDYFEEEDDLAYAPAPPEKNKSDLFNFLHRKDKKSDEECCGYDNKQ